MRNLPGVLDTNIQFIDPEFIHSFRFDKVLVSYTGVFVIAGTLFRDCLPGLVRMQFVVSYFFGALQIASVMALQ